MASAAIPIQYHDEGRGEGFLIPAAAHSFDGFRRWSQTSDARAGAIRWAYELEHAPQNG